MLALSNRDRIGRALEILGGGLTSFVDQYMAAFLPGGRDWLDVMTDRARKEGRPGKMSRSDPRVLLRVIVQNPGAFREPLSRLELAYAREIAEVANQWAHLGPFSDADTSRALDTMMRFLRAASTEGAASQVAELLLGRHSEVPGEADLPGQVDGAAGFLGPEAAQPAGHHEPDGRHASGEEARPAGTVDEFRDCDGDYLAWVAAHSSGYVVNVGRSGRGLAVLHRASCGTITSSPPFTDSYIKVCSPSLGPLDRWALQRNGAVAQRCGICHPPSGTLPAAAPAPWEAARAPQATVSNRSGGGGSRHPALRPEAQRARASKYDSLRDFLTARGAGPVTLTFTQIDQLVGALPPSARLYHLWWRDDDPSHPHCRSWNDAGYTAHPDFKAQKVTFIPRSG